MTEEQLTESDALYAEQLRRYKKKIKEYNKAATKATGLKHGDKVKRLQANLFGLTTVEYFGKVIYDKNGRLVIRIKMCDGSGRKTFPINKGWKKIENKIVHTSAKSFFKGCTGRGIDY